MYTWNVGIDEVGRGPLAGPVAVGVVKVPADFDWTLIPGVGDSKKVTPKKREIIFKRASELQDEGQLAFAVVMISAAEIDARGIVPAITSALTGGLERLIGASTLPTMAACYDLRLDGGLKAPVVFTKQTTIIKGDVTEPTIGLASIVAKVTRDRYMDELGLRYPNYDFAAHKGYGTKAHRAAIIEHGLLPDIHRRSFCKNLLI